MRKKYKSPVVQIVHCPMEHLLQSGSDGNKISGTIHSNGTDETIGSGNEDDEEGVVASSKSSSFDYEW